MHYKSKFAFLASTLIIFAMLSGVLTRHANGLSLQDMLGLNTELLSSKIDLATKNLADKTEASSTNKSELQQTFSDPFKSKVLNEKPGISIVSLPTNDHVSVKEMNSIGTNATCDNDRKCEKSQTLSGKESISINDESNGRDQIINSISKNKNPFELPIDIPFP
ncbi:MAG: hypothetical protein WCE93_05440 [Nitrososphaeraceae archaeon]